MAYDDSVSSSANEHSNDHLGAIHRHRRVMRRKTANPFVGEMSPSVEKLLNSSELQCPLIDSTSAWVRFFSQLFGPALDSKLAKGEFPDSSPLLMARARSIVSSQLRWNLADWWLDLLIQARQPWTPRDARVPVVRSRVLRVEWQIRELANALLAPLVTVRGVAMANSLLCDGSGPIYNPSCSVDLAATLREIIGRLDPTT